LKQQPEEIPDTEHEFVLERVCAIDVAKDSGKVCVRVSGRAGKRVSKVWDVPARSGAVAEVAEHLLAEGIEKITVMDLAVGLGGIITGEHSVGRPNRPWLAGRLGQEAMELNERIKKALDPRRHPQPGRGNLTRPRRNRLSIKPNTSNRSTFRTSADSWLLRQ
jgi:hypothetical protein